MNRSALHARTYWREGKRCGLYIQRAPGQAERSLCVRGGIRVNTLQSGRGLFVEGVREGGSCGSLSIFDVLLELLRVSDGSRSCLTKLCRTTRREKKFITTQRHTVVRGVYARCVLKCSSFIS